MRLARQDEADEALSPRIVEVIHSIDFVNLYNAVHDTAAPRTHRNDVTVRRREEVA